MTLNRHEIIIFTHSTISNLGEEICKNWFELALKTINILEIYQHHMGRNIGCFMNSPTAGSEFA